MGRLGKVLLNIMTYKFQSVSPPDPFADATKGDDRLPAGTDDYIHIRIQQRNGRKTLTTVQGIAPDYDKKKLVKAFKKVLNALLFACRAIPNKMTSIIFSWLCCLFSPYTDLMFCSLLTPIEVCLQWDSD